MSNREILARLERTQVMHLKRVVTGFVDHASFGVSAIQRVCKIGYNNACHIAERGKEEGVITNVGELRYTLTDEGRELGKRLLKEFKEQGNALNYSK